MKQLLSLIFCFSFIFSQKVFINSATIEELKSLPLSENQIADVYDFILFQGPVSDIYDLIKISSIDAKDIDSLKSLVSIKDNKNINIRASRISDRYRKVENWTSEEGANEGLVEVWLDRLAEPKNINSATWNDLMALQNVSPVDAVAVMKRIDEGKITYPKALRGAIGLSYWGYRNMVDFFTYDDTDTTDSFHFWYNTTYKTLPSTTSFDDEVGMVDQISDHPGDLHHKMVATFGRNWKLSLATHRQLGEKVYDFKVGDFEVPNSKWSLTYRDLKLGSLKIDRVILGNFSATIGQGVIFENTDFFSPRRSGYSWSRRVHGVFPDISRTRQYALRGAAFQAGNKMLDLMGFVSRNKRDAILNIADSSVASMITLYPRTNSGFGADSLLMPMLETLEEVTYGGSVRLIPLYGTFIGFSAYESLYDRPIRPDIATTVIADANEGKFLTSIGNTADTEIAAMYSSYGESSFWDKAKSFRRVFGMDFSTVIRNIALQGEYGILDKNGDMKVNGSDPKAFVFSGYAQFNNFSLLVVYRDYDLGFDNPYQRSFSNYSRYKGSIFEDTFYLEDPIYGFLYTGQAQPQSEKGIYINSRYQPHRALVLSGDFDTWTRVADQARYFRTVMRAQYRPVFNMRFSIRHKWQKRGSMNHLDPSAYYSQETIIRSQIRLSGYDQIELMWVRSWVDFSNRRRLTNDLTSGGEEPSLIGSAGTGSEAIGFKVTHNFNQRMKAMGQVIFYNGFIWNFEDTDFRVFDSNSDAVRYWLSLFSRINDRWAVRLKWTVDSSAPVTNYIFEPSDPTGQFPDQRLSWKTVSGENFTNDIRLQLDYAF
ncbi:MAG: ComEA family DNA-binding protein [Candidatus Neomarinimicrobiota bacterium]